MNFNEPTDILDIEPVKKKMKSDERRAVKRIFRTSNDDDTHTTTTQSHPTLMETIQSVVVNVLIITIFGIIVSFIPREIVPISSDLTYNIVRSLTVAIASVLTLSTLKQGG